MKTLLVFLENIMKKVKVIFSSIIYIILLFVLDFLVLSLFSFYFYNTTSVELNSAEYNASLASFLSKNQLLIVLISMMFWVPLFIKQLRKRKIEFNSVGVKNLQKWIWLVISTNIIWNILLYDIGKLQVPALPMLSTVLATCILGPILEEFVFRGIIYSKLKTIFSKEKAIFLVSLFFAIYHFNLLQGIYAFFVSIIVTIIYDKYNNFWLPIIIHCIGNLVSSLLLPFLLPINLIFIQVIGLFLTISMIFLIKKKNFYI